MSPALQDRLASGESVRVVVELRRPADSPSAGVAGAPAALARVQARLLERVPHIGAAKRMANLPIVAMEVDSRALSELEMSPVS